MIDVTKKMNFCMHISLILFVSFGFLQARFFMPAIDLVKGKIDKALSETPKTSLKELFEKGIIKHKDKNSLEYNETVNNLIAQWDRFYWCKQDEISVTLKNTLEKSKPEAFKLMQQKVNARYSSARNPLISFAHDLAQEETNLQTFINDIIKAISENKKDNPNYETNAQKLSDLLTKSTGAITILSSLTQTVNLILS
jgi:hypothetical protein